MDLATLKPTEAMFEITHPGDGKEIGIRVGILSLDDDKLKTIKRELANTRLKLEQRGKSFSADQVEENFNRLMFAAMTGWEWYGDVTFHGSKPQFNQDTVFRVFSELNWFRTQVSEKVGETKDFFPT